MLVKCDLTGGGIDYDSGPYTITVPARQIYVSFNVSIIDDNTLELNETFTLTIDPSSLVSHLNVSNPDHSTVIIVDNDGKSTIQYVYICR